MPFLPGGKACLQSLEERLRLPRPILQKKLGDSSNTWELQISAVLKPARCFHSWIASDSFIIWPFYGYQKLSSDNTEYSGFYLWLQLRAEGPCTMGEVVFLLRLTVCKRSSGRDKNGGSGGEMEDHVNFVTAWVGLCFPLGLSGVIRADRQRMEHSENDTALSEVSVLYQRISIPEYPSFFVQPFLFSSLLLLFFPRVCFTLPLPFSPPLPLCNPLLAFLFLFVFSPLWNGKDVASATLFSCVLPHCP